MGMYKFADFNVDLQNRFDYLSKLCKGYETDSDSADFTVCVCDEEIENERNGSLGDFSDGYLESVCAYRKLCLALPSHDAMLLHGAVVQAQGRGIIFLARSGVGKSTHMMLWKQLLGDKLTVVNGDKPIVRFFGGVPFAYGTPWSGKEGLQTNMRVKLSDICFIERAKTNETVKISDPSEYVGRIMTQVLIPKDSCSLLKTMEMADILMNVCNLWQIKCTPDIDAAKTAYNAIFDL